MTSSPEGLLEPALVLDDQAQRVVGREVEGERRRRSSPPRRPRRPAASSGGGLGGGAGRALAGDAAGEQEDGGERGRGEGERASCVHREVSVSWRGPGWRCRRGAAVRRPRRCARRRPDGRVWWVCTPRPSSSSARSSARTVDGAVAGTGARDGEDPARPSRRGVVRGAEQDDAVGEVERLLDVVRDEQDRRRLGGVHLAQQVLHLQPGQRVEGAERLVEQQDAGVAGQGPGERRRAAPSRRRPAAAAARPSPRARRGAGARRPAPRRRPSGCRGAGRARRCAAACATAGAAAPGTRPRTGGRRRPTACRR